jgi:hypothetical protein
VACQNVGALVDARRDPILPPVSGNHVRLDDRVAARIDPTYWWGPRRPFDWDVQLKPNVLLSLEFETGASQSTLDLSQLHSTEVCPEDGRRA